MRNNFKIFNNKDSNNQFKLNPIRICWINKIIDLNINNIIVLKIYNHSIKIILSNKSTSESLNNILLLNTHPNTLLNNIYLLKLFPLKIKCLKISIGQQEILFKVMINFFRDKNQEDTIKINNY